jgi:hypothetical protein
MIAALAVMLLAAATPTPLPSFPPLPEIYHSISRPLCSSLQDRIRPALGLMIENDATIKKSLPDFSDYIHRAAEGSDAGKDIAVLRLESLVTPLMNNTLAVQKLLEDPAVFPPEARTDDDKRLLQIKTQMLHAIATQEASLDIINGFVQTQQMAELQHADEGYISSLASGPSGPSSPSPDPMHPQGFDDLALDAGLAPNPYQIDLTQIPGLALGYNPIGRIREGVVWTQDAAHKAEAPLAQTIIEAANSCGASVGQPAASPSPNP